MLKYETRMMTPEGVRCPHCGSNSNEYGIWKGRSVYCIKCKKYYLIGKQKGKND